MCKKRVIYGFLNTSWVLINTAPRNRRERTKRVKIINGVKTHKHTTRRAAFGQVAFLFLQNFILRFAGFTALDRNVTRVGE